MSACTYRGTSLQCEPGELACQCGTDAATRLAEVTVCCWCEANPHRPDCVRLLGEDIAAVIGQHDAPSQRLATRWLRATATSQRRFTARYFADQQRIFHSDPCPHPDEAALAPVLGALESWCREHGRLTAAGLGALAEMPREDSSHE